MAEDLLKVSECMTRRRLAICKVFVASHGSHRSITCSIKTFLTLMASTLALGLGYQHRLGPVLAEQAQAFQTEALSGHSCGLSPKWCSELRILRLALIFRCNRFRFRRLTLREKMR